MTKVFIDGSAGTTGLRIYDRLSCRQDISLITLPENLRKDIGARAEAINSADVVFLCLPDEVAKESVTLAKKSSVAIIDTSTAHRTNDEWVYGFAEIGMRDKIASGKRIANPGCHASGFIALVYPLIKEGIIKKSLALTSFSITGYSGGGKKMIAEYEQNAPVLFSAPRQYGLSQKHKHLPEMAKYCSLSTTPIFCPIVSSYAQGMEVTVPLFASDVRGKMDDIKQIYKNYYNSKIVHFDDDASENGFLSACSMANRDDMSISVFGNEDRILLVSRFDNLGKGASGAALQNMNILLGVDETYGLIVGE